MITCGFFGWLCGGDGVAMSVVWVVVLWWQEDGDVWCLIGFSEAAYVAAAGSSGGSPVVFMRVCRGCSGVGWTASWWNFGFGSNIRSLGGFVALGLSLCLGVGGWVIFESESPLGCSLIVRGFWLGFVRSDKD